ncbi:MAG: hypothetical protein BAA04_00135 [Firmicutes bacterium ZCTH02-B6]|nr:MAG: hypothetical protein BAA04_00135 [Firmicutes bacterium ZCTH02-B6]
MDPAQSSANPELVLLGLAVLDSINPSALLVTLYLLRRPSPARTVPAYVAGVFVAYFVIGVLLVLGFDALLTRFEDALRSPTAYAAQGVLGAAMLLYSFKPARQDKAGVEQRAAGAGTIVGLFALGAAVTVAEITTALPYFGATGLLTYVQWPTYRWVTALVLYNLIFVAPPLALLAATLVLGQRMDARMVALRSRLERMGQEAALWIIGIVGFYLLVDALAFFNFFGLVEVTHPGGAGSPAE